MNTTVDDIYSNIASLTTEMSSLKKSVSDGKALLANTITGLCVTTASDASGVGLTGTMANNATSTITLTLDENVTKTASFSSKIAKGFHTGSDTIKVDVSAVVAKAKKDAVDEVEATIPDTLSYTFLVTWSGDTGADNTRTSHTITCSTWSGMYSSFKLSAANGGAISVHKNSAAGDSVTWVDGKKISLSASGVKSYVVVAEQT